MGYLVILFNLLFAFTCNASSALNNASYTLTTVSVSTSAVQLAANSVRRYLLIQNNCVSAVYVKFGSTIATTEGISLAAGGMYEPRIPPTQSVWMKSSSGTCALTMYEGN